VEAKYKLKTRKAAAKRFKRTGTAETAHAPALCLTGLNVRAARMRGCSAVLKVVRAKVCPCCSIGSGKIMHRHGSNSHLQYKKDSRRQKRLEIDAELDSTKVWHVERMCPYL